MKLKQIRQRISFCFSAFICWFWSFFLEFLRVLFRLAMMHAVTKLLMAVVISSLCNGVSSAICFEAFSVGVSDLQCVSI